MVDASNFDPKARTRVPILRDCGRLGAFDRVVDITTAFEFYNVTYAVWGSLLNYIHGVPVIFSVSERCWHHRPRSLDTCYRRYLSSSKTINLT